MSGNPYLLAAYSVTWLIHITYLGTIVRRYVARITRKEPFKLLVRNSIFGFRCHTRTIRGGGGEVKLWRS